MLIAEFKRMRQLSITRICMGLLAILLLLEGVGILMQRNRYTFASNVALEMHRQAEYEETFSYKLSEKTEQLHSRQGSILFSNPRNQALINKEIQTAEKIMNTDVSLTHVDVVKHIISLSSVWSVVYLLLGILLIYYLFLQDDTAMMGKLYASTATSTIVRAFAKIMVLVASISFVSLVKIGIECLLLWVCEIPGNAPMQLINGFFTFEIDATIRQYVLLLNFQGTIASMLCLLLFVFLYLASGQWNLSLGILVLLLTGEYLAYSFLSESSSYSFLKHANLYASMFSSRTWNGYLVIHSSVISKEIILLGTIAFLCLLAVIAIVFRYGKQETHKKMAKRTIDSRLFSTIPGFHARDILFRRKGIYILLVLFLACLGNAFRYDAVFSADQLRYEAFRKTYYGELNQALLDRIESDREVIIEAIDKRDAYLRRYLELSEEEHRELDEWMTISLQGEFIDRVFMETSELYAYGATVYQNYDGIRYLMRKDDTSGSILDFLTAFLPVGMLVIAVFNANRRNALSKMTDCTATGRKAVLLSYTKILVLCQFMAYAIVYGCQAMRVMGSYPISLLGTVNGTMGIASAMPIWLYAALHYAHVLLLGVTFLITIEYYSIHYPFAMAMAILGVMTGVTIVPFVTQYISFDYVIKLPACIVFTISLLCIDGILIHRL